MDGSAPARTTRLTPAQTAAALAEHAVVRWWQTSACLQVAGPDAATLLDGLCTQAVERIEVGHAVPGLFLDAKARIIAPALLHRMSPADWEDPRAGTQVPDAPRLLLETLPELLEPLAAHLARYRLRARAGIAPAPVATAAVVGAAATTALEVPAPDGGEWTVVAGLGIPTCAFLGTAQACHELVTRRLPEAGLLPADPDTVEAERIDRRAPGLHDLQAGRMPAEVGGMQAAVALDAGCYLGQEPVARLHYRGRAQRGLRRLESSQPIEPVPADAVDTGTDVLELRRPDGSQRAVGRLTTWATRPDGTQVALAVVRREVEADERLSLAGVDHAQLRVVDGPER